MYDKKTAGPQTARGSRARRWLGRTFIVTGLLLLALVMWLKPWVAMRSATGLTAHSLCSGAFITGQDPKALYSELTSPLMGPIAPLVSWHVDKVHKTVSASILGFSPARAVYSRKYGCTLGTQKVAVTNDDDLSILPYYEPPLTILTNDAVETAIDHVFRETPGTPIKHVKAVVVMRDGAIIGERYAPGYSPDTRLLSWSVAKSFTNAIAGILVHKGRLQANRSDLAPEWAGGDPRRLITVEDLLRMQSGLDAPEDGGPTDAVTQMLYSQDDMAAFAAQHPQKKPAGSEWEYTSAGTLILDRALGRAIGGGAAGFRNFTQTELFEPLGMRSVTLEYDGSGTFIGSSYVYATARDFARFGAFFLNDGVAPSGQRLLPHGWVNWSRKSTLGRGYGAGFWTNDGPSVAAAERIRKGFPRDGYFASGNMGQRIYVIPSSRLVIVRFGYSSPPEFGIDDDLALIKAAVTYRDTSTQGQNVLNQ